MTLTELIISSMLIGIIILGTLSADFAIRTWQKRIEQRTLVQLDLMRAMEQILKRGRVTIGSETCDNGDGSTLCSSNFNDNALNYSEDTGLNFISFRNDSTPTIPNDEIHYEYKAVSVDDYFNLPLYTYSTTPGWNLIDDNIITLTNEDFFTINKIAGKVTYITIHLETRPDPTSPVDPIRNPTYTLETSFMPAGLTQ